MTTPTYEELIKLRQQGNVIPVFKAVMADLLTPVSAFMKIAQNQDYAFLLESIEGGEKIARYSPSAATPFSSSAAKRTRSSWITSLEKR